MLCLLFAMTAAPGQVPKCHRNNLYVVAVLENTENPGSRIAISPAAKAKAACVFDGHAAYEIGDGDEPLWFAALESDKLILTRSTGPQGDLLVYDLGTRKLMLDVASDDFKVDPAGVTFWERVTEGNKDNCPEFEQNKADGLGSVIAEEARLEFASHAVPRSGKRRCDATQ